MSEKNAREPQRPTCPACGEAVTAISETLEPKVLCAPVTEGREKGERWRRYEPCGHET